jgi:hypothetical protein
VYAAGFEARARTKEELGMRDLIAWMVVAGLVGSTAVGCKKKKGDDDSARPEATAPAAAATPAPHPGGKQAPQGKTPAAASAPAGAAPALGEKEEIPSAHVVFNVPGGWKKSVTANGWALFKAPDNHARLGYVAFEQRGEATSRLGQLAEAFELTNMTWGSPTEGTVGKDHFPDHEGDTTSCTLKNGDPCAMRYMTINPGGPVQMMVVYLVNTAHGEHQRSHATASVNSLRRM